MEEEKESSGDAKDGSSEREGMDTDLPYALMKVQLRLMKMDRFHIHR
jgi:hypothetical protein